MRSRRRDAFELLGFTIESFADSLGRSRWQISIPGELAMIFATLSEAVALIWEARSNGGAP